MLSSSRFNTRHEPVTGDVDVDVHFVKKMDDGYYICKAENPLGTDETFTRINILDVPNIDETPFVDPHSFDFLNKPDSKRPFEKADDPAKHKPPKFVILLPKDVNVNDGAKANLKCKVEGYPLPEVPFSFVYAVI